MQVEKRIPLFCTLHLHAVPLTGYWTHQQGKQLASSGYAGVTNPKSFVMETLDERHVRNCHQDYAQRNASEPSFCAVDAYER